MAAKPKSGKLYRTLASAQKAHARLVKQGYYDAGVVYDASSGKYRVLFKEKNPGSIMAQLRKGIRGHIKLSRGRLIIKT